MRSVVTVTDQFCGAGGSSIGVAAAGAELRLAMNHWRLAVETHNSNFPNAAHDCVDISGCDPRRYPATDILITSPECTNHSLAKGAQRQTQAGLFDGPFDPSAERSRATMWDVPRFAEQHDYRLIIVENVVDARLWRLFDAWLLAMQLLDYEREIVYFNSMFAPPTPQSRDRMYVVFWKRAGRKPDLAFRPLAHCAKCGPVAAMQSFKATKLRNYTWGRYGKRGQYDYLCPQCGQEVRPGFWPAYTAIDWALPMVRIGDRKKPLKPNTLKRIETGLRKFGRVPVAVPLDYSQEERKLGYPVTGPLPTQTTRQTLALAAPFLVGNYSPGWTRPMSEPLGTITTSDHHAVVTPPAFITQFYNGGTTNTDVHGPIGTITSNPHHGLVTMPFLASYYNGRDAVHPVTEAMGTVSTVDRHALVQPDGDVEDLRVEDCGFRMLVPAEIKKAMAFPDEYVLLGNGREQVRLLGNAVTPPVMEMIFRRCVETLQ